jgi:hypothetical protein
MPPRRHAIDRAESVPHDELSDQHGGRLTQFTRLNEPGLSVRNPGGNQGSAMMFAPLGERKQPLLPLHAFATDTVCRYGTTDRLGTTGRG